MSPELETLDQLLDGPLQLDVVVRFFPDQEACRYALAALSRDGCINLLRRGIALRPFEVEKIFCDPIDDITIEMTERGGQRIA